MQKRLMLHRCETALSTLKVAVREFSTLPRMDIAPAQWIGAVWTREDGVRAYSGFRWGLTPSFWDSSAHAGHLLFSARAETLANKSAFASALKFRRAVVPVDGFWMWKRVDEQMRPFLLRSKNSEPLFLAAIWDEAPHQHDEQGERRLALVSVEANRLTEPFGARMPAILRQSDVELWLERGVSNEKPLLRLLKTPTSRELLVTATNPYARGKAGLLEATDARDALAQIYGAAFRPEKPRFSARRRQVLRDHEIGGQVFFRTRSFTRDDATRWHPVVDVEHGHVFCDCPDFHYRHQHHEPDVWTPHWWCKHVRRAVENLKRKGELPSRPFPEPTKEDREMMVA